jgi:LL-diaminopimelate aminotransferase
LTWALEHLGVEVFPARATFYIWFRVGGEEMDFVNRALESGVMFMPGSAFGPGGKGWVRASVTAPDEVIDAAAQIIIGMK